MITIFLSTIIFVFYKIFTLLEMPAKIFHKKLKNFMDDPKIMTDSYLAAFVTSVFSMFNEPALGNQMIYFVTSLVFFIVMIVEHSKIKKKTS